MIRCYERPPAEFHDQEMAPEAIAAAYRLFDVSCVFFAPLMPTLNEASSRCMIPSGTATEGCVRPSWKPQKCGVNTQTHEGSFLSSFHDTDKHTRYFNDFGSNYDVTSAASWANCAISLYHIIMSSSGIQHAACPWLSDCRPVDVTGLRRSHETFALRKLMQMKTDRRLCTREDCILPMHLFMRQFCFHNVKGFLAMRHPIKKFFYADFPWHNRFIVGHSQLLRRYWFYAWEDLARAEKDVHVDVEFLVKRGMDPASAERLIDRTSQVAWKAILSHFKLPRALLWSLLVIAVCQCSTTHLRPSHTAAPCLAGPAAHAQTRLHT